MSETDGTPRPTPEARIAELEAEAVANQTRWDELLDEREAEITRLRVEGETLRTACEMAVNSLNDVTSIGRFSKAVDPVKWCEQLQAELRAALLAAQGAP